ncbi:uba domain-containing protein 3 [Stemphylium lycopersici]|uniref:Uba domain-containing protein 3 n=1 Tax=Stemphylium lycopersici TaxID=183478 RepID=A0A364MVI3_STELY|nr:uba domain-containing protein 3 [Stemphylium lycopersici]
MASALNKRQQARNERTLQELIKTVAGNGTCADCGARNPGWASWSLGIFLCMRCAALHRKLGTHISKVKSLSMDKWDNAQVDNMKRIGNIESNKTYNPRNVKPQIPIDIDEVDSAMERYIRAKYEQRVYMNDSRPGTRQNTGSTSSEDRPPPLPPKPTGRFGLGLRKAATSPRNITPPLSPGLGGFSQDASPPRVNKASRVFGSNIHTSSDGMDSKLATLRDMGFPDDKRNSTVLKGLNGNLDRTVEALIRLGEQNPVKSRGSTPTPPTRPTTNGISFDNPNTAPPSSSTNPFDALDAQAQAQQQQQQQPQLAPIQTQPTSYGGPQGQQQYPSNSYNPFLAQAAQGYAQQQMPQQQQQQGYGYQQNLWEQQQQNPWDQQQQNLEQSLQGMQISNQQPQQPLFPNRTGGHAQPQPSYAQTNPYHQSFTPPPMPQIPEQYSSFFASQQPQYQSMSNPSSPGNPFLRSSRSQVFTPANVANSNPFGQSTFQQQPAQPQSAPPQSQMPNPWSQQQQQQHHHHHQQQQQQQQLQPQSQVSTPQTANPWQSQSSYQNQDPHQNYQTQQQNFQSQQQMYQQQSSNPFDKNASILSLYNQPQQAPQQAPVQQAQPTAVQASTPAAQAPGQSNPFASLSGAPQGQPLYFMVASPADYYKVLDVDSKASQQQIRDAYKKCPSLSHAPSPHRNRSNSPFHRVPSDSPERASRTKRFQQINDAYYTLSDATRRRDYDAARTYNSFTGSTTTPDSDFEEEEIPNNAGGGGGGGGAGFAQGFPWSAFGFGSAPAGTTEESHNRFSDEQFGGIFEEMLREEGMAEGAEAAPTGKFWSLVGGLSGGAMGFIVANFPGMVAGAVAGNRLGAVRDTKGKSVYAVFQEMPQADKARLLSGLAAKVFANVVSA